MGITWEVTDTTSRVVVMTCIETGGDVTDTIADSHGQRIFKQKKKIRYSLVCVDVLGGWEFEETLVVMVTPPIVGVVVWGRLEDVVEDDDREGGGGEGGGRGGARVGAAGAAGANEETDGVMSGASNSTRSN